MHGMWTNAEIKNSTKGLQNDKAVLVGIADRIYLGFCSGILDVVFQIPGLELCETMEEKREHVSAAGIPVRLYRTYSPMDDSLPLRWAGYICCETCKQRADDGHAPLPCPEWICIMCEGQRIGSCMFCP